MTPSTGDGRTPRRVVVVGNCGSGKTTLARSLAARLDVEHVELDGIFHQPNWVELPRDEFGRRVGERLDAASEGWTACGNYSSIRDVVWSRADTVVWLDLPRRIVMRRLTARTVRRVLTREDLWNGNREPLSNLYSWDPQKNIIRWAWTKHDGYRERLGEAVVDPQWSHLRFVPLRTPAEIDRWLAAAGSDR
jgi:adenylate kinase family enzyme